MSADKEALARRAVACKHWRWMPGMAGVEPSLANKPSRLGRRLSTRRRWASESNGPELRMPWAPDDDWLPDLGDPATLGCLLALVREAWGCCVDIEEFYTTSGLHQFAVRCTDGDATVERRGGTLASALVAALEAAP